MSTTEEFLKSPAFEEILKEATPEQWLKWITFVFDHIRKLPAERQIEIAITLLEQRQNLTPLLVAEASDLLRDSLREWDGGYHVRSIEDAEFALEIEAIKPLPENLRARLVMLASRDYLISGLVKGNPLLVQFGVALLTGEPVTVREAYHAIAPDLKRELHRQRRIDRNPGGTGKNPEYEHEVAESNLDLPEDVSSPLELATSNEPDPAEVVENADLLERVFEHLKAEEHVILQMFADGHTDEEVAVLLGTTPEAIKKRRQRLINRLRQSLAS